MSNRAANIFAIYAAIALIIALTVRYWGPYVDRAQVILDPSTVAAANVHAAAYERVQCK